MPYSFTSVLQRFDDNKLWHFHISVPQDIVNELKEKGTRVICTLNQKYSFQTALLSAGERGYFINLNKDIREKLNLMLHDEIQVELQPDESEYGLPVPDVFAELLHQDPEFDQIFHALTKGKQRTLLHMIGKFKTEAKQLEKLLVLRNYLVSVNGKLDYKELNEAFKRGF